MKSLKFKVTAKSNIILIASSNTEGNINYLDFIPGSVFLGIVAKHYDEFREPFKIFHSGSVRFMDADICINNKPSFKVPLSVHIPKVEKKPYFNYFKLTNEEFKKYKQFKQIREGYINNDLEYEKLIYDYSLKSARDYKKGRSKSSAMFGYKSIAKGSEFLFEVQIDESVSHEEIEKIKEYLIGEKHIGKSKSGEYSLVEIEMYDFDDKIETFESDKVYVYLKSRAVLIDENGNQTFDIKNIHTKIKKDNVKYEESFIRYTTYISYNQKRQQKDFTRCVIEKGSVLVFENLTKEILEDIQRGIGVFKNEGFGKVIVNPWFLKEKILKIKHFEKQKETKPIEIISNLGKYLKNKKSKLDLQNELIKKVDKYIKEESIWFSNIKPSQWGRIRAIAKKYKNNAIDEIQDYISSGIKSWREDQQQKLLNFIETIDYKGIIYLATEMAKLKDNK